MNVPAESEPRVVGASPVPGPTKQLQQWQVIWQGVAAVCQLVVLIAVSVTAVVAYEQASTAINRWRDDVQKRRTDRTLDHIGRVTDRTFINSLWDIQEFTLCFERHRGNGHHLSYRRFAEIGSKEIKDLSLELAQQWWSFIEDEHLEMEECGKPVDVERTLMDIYSRLEAMASCSKAQVCDFRDVREMIEAFDYLTVLAISNYILLATIENNISREWLTTGSFDELVVEIENYVFNRQVPMITTERQQQIWSKWNRCNRTDNAGGGLWRWCVNPRRPPSQ